MNEMDIHDWIRKDIPFLQGYRSIEQIHKGYSGDLKFIVRKDGIGYLLKCFRIEEWEQRQAEYLVLRQMERIGVKCSYPVDKGRLSERPLGYMILTYVEGEDASDALPLYSEEEQYRIGIESGRQLSIIHSIAADDRMEGWHVRKLPKHLRYMEQYKQGGIRIAGDSRIVSFIDDNVHLMKDRPNLFQHDDFHTANLIVRNKELAGVIDFGRMDWGDPVHDFLKTGFFSAEVSVPFSVGLIRGYRRMEEPDEHFWRLYALYVAMCAISSIVWIMKVKPEEKDIMLSIIDRVVNDHDGFALDKPRWYT